MFCEPRLLSNLVARTPTRWKASEHFICLIHRSHRRLALNANYVTVHTQTSAEFVVVDLFDSEKGNYQDPKGPQPWFGARESYDNR